MRLKQLAHLSSLTLFFVLNIYFLLGVFLSRSAETLNLVQFLLLCIGVLLLFKFQLSLEHSNQLFLYDTFKAIFFVTIGALLTFYLILYLHLTAVISSAIIGLAASFLPSLKSKWAFTTQLPPLLYCGTFVGMTSPLIANSVTFIICAGAIAGIFFVISRNMFYGFGGKLGAIALWAVIVTSFVFLFFL